MADQKKSLVFEADIAKEQARQRVMRILVQIFLYVFLIIMALIIVFPFYFMLISSVKELAEYRLSVQTLWPNKIVWYNYVEAFNTANLGTLFSNTLYVGLVSTVLSLVITVITAFAFARLEFKGKNALFAALLATMMIPGELFTITNYQTISDFLGLRTLGRELGIPLLVAMGDWKNTFTVLIVPFLVSVFYIYLLRQNFLQIPNELYLAAKVDGTSDIKYLWKVMIPLAMPTLISITILKMMGAWNSYVWPRLITDDELYYLVSNGIQTIRESGFGRENVPAMMAAVVAISAPLIILFLVFRNKIMEGVARGGTKG